MRHIFKKIAFLLLIISLTCIQGCATPYQRLSFDGGYSDFQLKQNEFRVSFKGNAATSRDTVQNYLLYRCAELTIQNNYDYFVILGADTERASGTINTPSTYTSQTTVSTNTTASVYGYGNSAYGTANTYGNAYTYGTINPGLSIPYSKYGSTATIKLYKGSPDGIDNAYGARKLKGYIERYYPNLIKNQVASSAANYERGTDDKKRIDGAKQSNKEAAAWLAKSAEDIKNKKWADAIRTTSAAISFDDKLIDAYIYRSWAYSEKGFYDKGIADAKKAISINPNSNSAYNNLGMAYQGKGDENRALASYKIACINGLQVGCLNYKAIAGHKPIGNQDKVKVLLDQSLKEFKNKNWDKVIDLSNSILLIDKNNSKAYSNKAGALAEKGMLNEAIDEISKAIKLNPDNGIAYHNKGYMYELLHENKDAALQYEISCGMGIEQSCTDLKRLQKNNKSGRSD